MSTETQDDMQEAIAHLNEMMDRYARMWPIPRNYREDIRFITANAVMRFAMAQAVHDGKCAEEDVWKLREGIREEYIIDSKVRDARSIRP
jgi:hypothetical protein